MAGAAGKKGRQRSLLGSPPHPFYPAVKKHGKGEGGTPEVQTGNEGSQKAK